MKLIEPILVGHKGRSPRPRPTPGSTSATWRSSDAEHSVDAARKAVALVREGRADALMKGSLHTDELMSAVVARETGLRTGRRISHCFIMDVPDHADALIITDAAVNIAPDLKTKVDITQNAIDLAHALGVPQPLVAILSAMETSTPTCPRRSRPRRCARWPTAARSPAACSTARWRSTTRSAPRRRRSRRSSRRSRARPISSSCPTSNPATCWPRACRSSPAPTPRASCSGAKVPIILTSRADSLLTRLASCAVALMLVAARRAQARGSDRMSCIAVLNAGSSSIKFALYADGTGDELLFKGQIEKIGTAPRMKVSSAAGEKLLEREWPADELDHRAGTNVILQTCLDLLDGRRSPESATAWCTAGRTTPRRCASTRGDRKPRRARAARAAAPAAQPRADPGDRRGRARHAAGRLLRHRVPPLAARAGAALRDPKELTEEGVRRYGFHGLSYEFIASRLAAIAPNLAAGNRSSATSATAPASARSRAARATRRRWASPRSRA
jgi:phosphate acetyltransferase